MKTLLFIYNATSGKGLLAEQLSAIVDVFTKAGYLVTAYPTQSRGDATRAARAMGGNFDRVVCSGGDGTLSETAAGMFALKAPPELAYVPAGSTNDCAATLHIPSDPLRAASLAAQGAGSPWDIGTLNGRPFVYVAAFGAFTEVAYETPQDLKKTFGHLAYIMAGIGSIPSIAPYHMKVEFDGQTLEDDFLYGMVCNSVSIGGMKAIPSEQVVLDDGYFEVVLVRNPVGVQEMAAGLQSLLRRAPAVGGPILTFHASRLRFTSEAAVPWTLDGEFGGSAAVSSVENHRRAIRIVRGEQEKTDERKDGA